MGRCRSCIRRREWKQSIWREKKIITEAPYQDEYDSLDRKETRIKKRRWTEDIKEKASIHIMVAMIEREGGDYPWNFCGENWERGNNRREYEKRVRRLEVHPRVWDTEWSERERKWINETGKKPMKVGLSNMKVEWLAIGRGFDQRGKGKGRRRTSKWWVQWGIRDNGKWERQLTISKLVRDRE